MNRAPMEMVLKPLVTTAQVVMGRSQVSSSNRRGSTRALDLQSDMCTEQSMSHPLLGCSPFPRQRFLVDVFVSSSRSSPASPDRSPVDRPLSLGLVRVAGFCPGGRADCRVVGCVGEHLRKGDDLDGPRRDQPWL